MHVALNALCIENRSGTGRYAAGLIEGFMHREHETWRLSVIVPSGFRLPRLWHNSTRIRFYAAPVEGPWRRVWWEQTALPRLLRQLKPDVLHSPAFTSPWARKTPWKNVVTVHDLAFLRFPETLPPARRVHLRLSALRSARAAERVITDSMAVAEELRNLNGFRHPIDPIPLGVDLRWFTDAVSNDAPVLERLGIGKPYFLFLGTVEPRKNLESLLAAYAAARRKGLKTPLVVAGRFGWRFPESLLRQEGIVHAGFVSEYDLPALYRNAESVFAPSLYEGYDLPVAEALACGAPVIASNIPVHRELLGNSAPLIEPGDLETWTRAFLHPLAYHNPRPPGRIRDWREVAEDTLRAYRACLET